MKNKNIKILLFLISLPVIVFITFKNNDPEIITDMIIECSYQKNQKDREICINKYLTSDIKIKNYKSILKKINNEATTNITFKNNCHEIAHYIGESAYKRYREAALTRDTPSCGEGYIHAIMGNFITSEENIKKLISFCTNYQQNSREKALCYHGIGHSYGEKFDKKNIYKKDILFITEITKFCEKIENIAKNIYQEKNQLILPGCFSGGYTQFYESLNQQLEVENKEIYSADPQNCISIKDSIVVECFRISVNYNILSKLDKKIFRTNDLLSKKISIIDDIYTETNLYCESLETKNQNIGCMRGIATSYVNAVLSKNILKNIEELKIDDYTNYIKNICKLDNNKNSNKECMNTFINELKEKIDINTINSINEKLL